MDLSRVEKIANAVLYEGYILYPYRPTAIKNQQRWNFGVLFPKAFSDSQSGTDSWKMQTQCLVSESGQAELDLRVRFLHLVSREVAEVLRQPAQADSDGRQDYQTVNELNVDGKVHRPWQEAVERNIDIRDLKLDKLKGQKYTQRFSFPAGSEVEQLFAGNGEVAGMILRKREAVQGVIEISVERRESLFVLTVGIMNVIEGTNVQGRDEALMNSLVSVHSILNVRNGKFVSPIDPPEEFKTAVAECSNVGTWPVLVGDEGQQDMMLSSPIILYDYPQIAAESPGDLCDATETDELLTLCIMALSDQEKQEMLNFDDRARAILERTEMLPAEQLMKMHGAVRGLRRVEAKKQ